MREPILAQRVIHNVCKRRASIYRSAIANLEGPVRMDSDRADIHAQE
jgi:hypothetical protein